MILFLLDAKVFFCFRILKVHVDHYVDTKDRNEVNLVEPDGQDFIQILIHQAELEIMNTIFIITETSVKTELFMTQMVKNIRTMRRKQFKSGKN